MKKHIGYLAAVILGILVLAAALIYGFHRIAIRDQYNSTISSSSTDKREESDSAESEKQGTGNSFYQKLKNGEDVKIWIFGDRSAYDETEESDSWPEIFASKLENRYGVHVEIENFSLAGDNDSLSHYSLIQNRLGSSTDADAIFLSMGYYDNPFDFPLYFEAILRAIHLRAPAAECISLIESAALTAPEGGADEIATLTKKLTEHYGGLCISLAEAVGVSGQDYQLFTNGGLELTKEGQELYASWILKCVESDSSNGEDNSEEISLQTGSVSAFDQYSYIPADEFRRISDLDWQISAEKLKELGSETTGVIVVDYMEFYGRNDFNLSVDGQLFGGYGSDISEEDHTDFTYPIRKMKIVNNNANVTDYLSVSFSNVEQADGFYGIFFLGNLSFIKGNESYNSLPIPEKQTEDSASDMEIQETEPESFEDSDETDEESMPETEESTERVIERSTEVRERPAETIRRTEAQETEIPTQIVSDTSAVPEVSVSEDDVLDIGPTVSSSGNGNDIVETAPAETTLSQEDSENGPAFDAAFPGN